MTTLRDGKFRVSENLELVGKVLAEKIRRKRQQDQAEIVERIAA